MEELKLSEEQIQRIAKQAAELVFQYVYLEVGKTAFRLVLYVAGATVLAALAWLGLHQKITLGG